MPMGYVCSRVASKVGLFALQWAAVKLWMISSIAPLLAFVAAADELGDWVHLLLQGAGRAEQGDLCVCSAAGTAARLAPYGAAVPVPPEAGAAGGALEAAHQQCHR